MKYLAIAVIDSENNSLKDRVDKILADYNLSILEINEKSKDKNFDEIIDIYKNPPNEIKIESALIQMFTDKLKKPLSKFIDKEFNTYDIEEVYSVDKLLEQFDNKDYEKFPSAILTPGCEWIKEDIDFTEEWEKKVFSLLNQYKEKGVAVFINCDL